MNKETQQSELKVGSCHNCGRLMTIGHKCELSSTSLPEAFLTRQQTQKLLDEAYGMGPTNDFISALTTVLNKFYIKTLAERPERIW